MAEVNGDSTRDLSQKTREHSPTLNLISSGAEYKDSWKLIDLWRIDTAGDARGNQK